MIGEDEAIREVLQGRTESFRYVIDAYRTYLYHVVFSIVRHPKDAEDVTQEALLKIFKSLPHYRFEGLKTWMSRIAVNQAIDFKRSRTAARKATEETLEGQTLRDTAELPEAVVLQREMREKVRRSLDGLPDGYREIVSAYYLTEKTYQEIAAEQGLEIKSVESKLYRARQWIRQRWKEDDYR